MYNKKSPLNMAEHIQLAEDLRKARELLGPWMDRFYKAYPVNSQECKELKKVLVLLSTKTCNSQDNYWYTLYEAKDTLGSPYP